MTPAPKATRLSVVVPSRSQSSQAAFLARAIDSIRRQTALRDVAVEVLVCLDRGAPAPELPDPTDVRFVEAGSKGQAAALNAGAASATGDYLAFLEDDDQWHPERVAFGLRALEGREFTSSTQLEVDVSGTIVRINDFPTPSGWLMPMSSWHRVGPFDESYRWHLDNEWLGRLGESGLKRVHLVEMTAPVLANVAAHVRPWLLDCLRFGGPSVILGRHSLPVPLVNRLVHGGSGMARIVGNSQARGASQQEMDRLVSRFGRIPW